MLVGVETDLFLFFLAGSKLPFFISAAFSLKTSLSAMVFHVAFYFFVCFLVPDFFSFRGTGIPYPHTGII